MRGTNYSSNYLDGSADNAWYIEPNQLPFDMTDISDAGFNVVKIYGTAANGATHLAALDAMVAVDPNVKFLVLDFVTYETDYSVATGGANRTSKIEEFEDMITIFKEHPAVIGYGFGNENNLNLGTTPAADWYSLVDAACAAGKVIDATRYFFTVEGELGTYPGDASLLNLDAVGANIYRGATFTDLLQDIVSLTSKPFFLAEFGIERTDNTQGEQDDQATEVLALIQEAESYYPYICGWIHFKWTHNSNSSQFYHITAPLAQGVNQSRTKYTAYNTIKNYNITTSYASA